MIDKPHPLILITFPSSFNFDKKLFLTGLNSILCTIVNKSREVLVNGDKSTNTYKMNKSAYNKYLTKNITKTYKKPNKNKVNRINSEAKTIAEKLELDDRIQQLQETEAFILVKDLKEGFPNSPSFRLINPSKSEIGKISKHILDKINILDKSLLINTKLNQWKNTPDAISWFQNISDKNRPSFVNFDVGNFYPSI